ncbi:hypothetical protein MLD52_12400 [Puniceicoccaceae bacterium K14]|nr:hypothetical protein [Puniceicoccaceae bacterium K14]
MQSKDNIFAHIPVSRQMVIMTAFFLPIIFWKRFETGLTTGQIVFFYCAFVFTFFQVLKRSIAVRQWVLKEEIAQNRINEMLHIPIVVWRVMLIFGFAYMLSEQYF